MNSNENNFRKRIDSFFDAFYHHLGMNDGKHNKGGSPIKTICTIVISLLVFFILVFLITLLCFNGFSQDSHKIIFLIIIIGSVLAAGIAIGVIAIVKIIPLLGKSIDQYNKTEERLLNAVIQSVEEEQECLRLEGKTKTALIERYAKTLTDEEVRNGDNQRKLAIMQQEYISHVADVALEMVKTNNKGQDQPSDQQMINQIIQHLIRQSNGQQ